MQYLASAFDFPEMYKVAGITNAPYSVNALSVGAYRC
jgi:hypothetical protein